MIFSKSKILLVEDESIIALSFEQSLNFLGYDVVGIAATGDEALRLVELYSPDLVLMDIVLKGELDGIETASLIMEKYDIPIVYLTAHPEESVINRAKLTSPYGYLIKPVNKTELKNTIDLALYKHDMERELRLNDERLHVVMDSVEDIIFIKDINHRYVDINPVSEQFFGLKPEEIIGKSDIELLNPELVDRTRLIDKRVLNNETVKMETPPMGPDKTVFDIIKSPMHDRKGNVIGICGVARDTTERKRIESDLRYSEKLLSDIIEFLPDATFAIDLDGKVIAWNSAIQDLTQVKKEDILGKGDYAYSIPFYGVRRPCLIELINSEDSRFVKHYDYVKRDGSKCYAEISMPNLYNGKGAYLWVTASPLLDNKGHKYGSIESIRDITERKKAENALRKSEHHFRAVVESAVDVIITSNFNGEVIYCNDSITTIFGYNKDEIIGQSVMILIPERYHKYYIRELDRFKASHKDLRAGKTFKSTGLKKDGTELPLEISLSAWRSEEDNFFTMIIHEDTHRVDTDEALRESEAKYRAFFESDPDYAILVDLNGFIVDVNQAAERISGLKRSELVGRNFSELHIFPDDELQLHERMFQKVLNNEDINPYEARIINKLNDEVRWVLNTNTSLRKEDIINHILMIGSDITERKNTEFKLKSSLYEKEVLLKEIHHRVKNNLQIISSLLDLQESYVKDNTIAVNVLKESQNRVLSMAMIHEMLYQTTDLSSINFSDYTRNLISNLLDSYRSNSTHIKTVLDVQELMLNIETSIPIGLIISELVSNSLKYAFPHQQEGEIQLTLKSTENEYNLIISDNGIGLPTEFDFRNAESSLGLQLVNSLVNQVEGTIELDQSNGTTYTIKFKQLQYKERI